MKTRLGIVGPYDSVKNISEVANEFSDQLIITLFIYENVKELTDFIKQTSEIDVWLFSGQAPFTIAKKYLKEKNGFFPPLNGSSLTKVLIDASYKDQRNLEKLSFDTILTKELTETYLEVGLCPNKLYSYPYSGYEPTDNLVEYHYNLYKKKSVEYCITGVRSVYDKLIKMDVPVYRITPTKMAIRNTLLMAIQRSEVLYLKESQITVLILKVKELDQFISNNKLSFDNYRLNLKLQEIIITFTEKISGTFVSQGNGKFTILSTRGSLESRSNNLIDTFIKKISITSNMSVNIGVGYGNTVYGAEKNAYLALNDAENTGKNIAIISNGIGDFKRVSYKNNPFSYGYQSEDKEILKKLKNAGVSLKTYNKIITIQENQENGPISANTLSIWLSMTARNARRILHALTKNDLAKVTGMENPTTRGRPSKLYRIRS